MPKKKQKATHVSKLWQRAEEALEASSDDKDHSLRYSPDDMKTLIHDYQVSQIELEMQNDELKRSQEKLDTSRARYFDFFNMIPIGFFSINEQQLILECNLTAATLLEWSLNEFTNQPITRFILKEDQDIYYLHSKQAFETKKPQACDLRMMKSDGSALWVRLATTTVRTVQDQLISRTVMSDITERKLAEKEKEKLLHDLGERIKELNCLYGIAKVREKSGITFERIIEETVNLIPPAWQYPEITCARIVLDNTEYKTDNFQDTKWKQSVDISIPGEIVGEVAVYYLEEKPESNEGPFLKEERHLINAIAERLGRITERMLAEEMLLDREKLQGVLEMAGAICHELNQPLQVVSGSSELLLMDIKNNDPKYKSLKNIETSIKRMTALMHKIDGITRYQSKPYLKSKIIDIEQASQYEKGSDSP